jgi:hypothetical protein
MCGRKRGAAAAAPFSSIVVVVVVCLSSSKNMNLRIAYLNKTCSKHDVWYSYNDMDVEIYLMQR